MLNKNNVLFSFLTESKVKISTKNIQVAGIWENKGKEAEVNESNENPGINNKKHDQTTCK